MKKKIALICMCIALACSGCSTNKKTDVQVDTEKLISDLTVIANWRYTGDKEEMLKSARRLCSDLVYEEIASKTEQSSAVVDITDLVIQGIQDNGYLDANIREVDGRYYMDSSKTKTYGGYALALVGDATLKIEIPESAQVESHVGNTGYQIDILDYNIYDNGHAFIKVKIGAFDTISYEDFMQAHPELENKTYQGEGAYAIYTADSRAEMEKTYKLRLDKDGKVTFISNMELFIGEISE